jgi:hypothetical protein
MNSNSMELNIQKFAEGGSDGGSSESATVAQSQETGENAVNTADNTSVAGENSGADEVTLDSIFEKYPELKKEADKRTQKAVQGRVHQINKSMQSQNDIIDKLMVHHGAKDVEELSRKLDSSLKEEFAVQHGVSEELGDEMLNLRVNNLRNARMREQYEAEMKVQEQLRTWQNEAEKVKEIYPDFDLEKELGNNDFRRLISANETYRMPMKQIYEMIHHDEIVEAAKKDTAAAYAKSTAQMQARPAENGLGNQVAVNGSMNVSKLTKKERAELAERARRGETITF